MSYNLYTHLRGLLPAAPLLVGTVTAIESGKVTVTLPDGSLVAARGEAMIGERVFVRDGAIEGPAPALPTILIEL